MRDINLIVIHCSATKAGQNISATTIDRWHRARGFQCIGYHYVILLDGTIVSGRNEESVGAHASGYNKHSIGVCYVGGLDKDGKPCDTRTDEQKIALQSLVATLLTRYPKAKVCGHRDLSPDLNHDGKITKNEWTKACPCFDAKDLSPKDLSPKDLSPASPSGEEPHY